MRAPHNALMADYLRRELLKPGMSIKALAGELGMCRPAVSNVLNGYTALSIPLALKIEQRFGLRARTLLIAQLDADLRAARRDGRT